MTASRRDFIKFVVAGSVAAGCPVDLSLLTAAPASSSQPDVRGEHFDICHSLRDGHRFDSPAPAQKAALVIVGGGVAGLSAAWFLRGEDFLLLEKEDHFGGNAWQEEFAGQPYGTGSAFAWKDDEGDQLARELGLQLLPVASPDSTIVNGVRVPDLWGENPGELPYPRRVRESFRKCREAMLKVPLAQRLMQLDSEMFSDHLAGYAPEVIQWWDGYGLSNWGAPADQSSALLGYWSMPEILPSEEDHRVILPGGLGSITHKLAELLHGQYRDRLLGNSTVVSVVQEQNEVLVTYLREGKLATVAAKAVLFCAPKFIAPRVVAGLPAVQTAAMHRIRYAPYPVVNLIFDKPVYNLGYDTWCPGNAFTDFIVADWTVRNQPGYHQKNNILTCYTPLREEQRSTLLTEDGCKRLAARVLADFQNLLPEFHANPVEVRLYRRGHPMFMATPGQYTRTRSHAAQPMNRIFFGNADSGGPESLTAEAIRLSRAGAEWARRVLSGKPGARELALKALAPKLD